MPPQFILSIPPTPLLSDTCDTYTASQALQPPSTIFIVTHTCFHIRILFYVHVHVQAYHETHCHINTLSLPFFQPPCYYACTHTHTLFSTVVAMCLIYQPNTPKYRVTSHLDRGPILPIFPYPFTPPTPFACRVFQLCSKIRAQTLPFVFRPLQFPFFTGGRAGIHHHTHAIILPTPLLSHSSYSLIFFTLHVLSLLLQLNENIIPAK